MALLTKYPLDLTAKVKTKTKISNPSVTGTNKGIVINQYTKEVIYCIDFILSSLHHLCMLISLKINNFEIHRGKRFSSKSYTQLSNALGQILNHRTMLYWLQYTHQQNLGCLTPEFLYFSVWKWAFQFLKPVCLETEHFCTGA